MASKSPPFSELSEDCDSCGTETPHRVSLQLKTESSKTENAQFSREPYRVAECKVCGSTTKTRMNDA